MTFDDVLVHPVMGRKPDGLGIRCIMAAGTPDFDCLHRLFNRSGRCHSRKLFMSRLHFGYEHTPSSLAGPFMGAPYAVILLESLIAWGISEVIFLGWCGAVSKDVTIGDIIIPDRSFMDDGTSKNYLKRDFLGDYAEASTHLQSRLKNAFATHQMDFHEGSVWSTDAIFRETKEKIIFFQQKGVLAVEMEAAALFAAGCFRGISVGCVLVVSDEVSSLKWKPGFRAPVFRQRRLQACEILQSF